MKLAIHFHSFHFDIYRFSQEFTAGKRVEVSLVVLVINIRSNITEKIGFT